MVPSGLLDPHLNKTQEHTEVTLRTLPPHYQNTLRTPSEHSLTFFKTPTSSRYKEDGVLTNVVSVADGRELKVSYKCFAFLFCFFVLLLWFSQMFCFSVLLFRFSQLLCTSVVSVADGRELKVSYNR